MPTIVLEIKGMTCVKCATRVKEAPARALKEIKLLIEIFSGFRIVYV